MIIFRCSQCRQKMRVGDEYSGKAVGCVKCGQLIRVPESDGESGAGVERKREGVIKFRCPSCNQKIGVGPEYAGRQVRCAKCKAALRVPEPKEEVAAREASSDGMWGEEAFEESGGGMFEGGGFGGELLDMEENALVEETLRLKPASRPARRSGGSYIPGGALGGDVDEEASGGGGERMGLAVAAGFAAVILGAAAWAYLTSLTGVFWAAFLATVVAPLAGLGLGLFTDRRSAGMGWLAVFIGLFGIMLGKVLIAKYVVMPKVRAAMKEVSESWMGGYDFSEMTDETIREAAGDDEFVIQVAYEELMEEGGMFEEGAAKDFGEEPPKSFGEAMGMVGKMAERMREVQEKARERAEGWSDEEREAAVRAYAEKMHKEDFTKGKVGAAIGGVGAFIGSFSCLDILWLPLALWFAYKTGAGR